MQRIYVIFVKRVLDLVAASLVLLLTFPLMLIVAILVRLKIGSPVLFQQPRPGRHGKTFELLKFRSMTNACDQNGELLPDHLRLSSFGRRLRSTSLDELPELIHVLRGEMSFVGPRPLLLAYMDRYTTEQARRHTVRPGITGWAQIHGRNSVPWEERLQLDVWYVDHVSFRLDLLILWRTLQIVISRRGVSFQDHATMPEFAPDHAREDDRRLDS